MTSNREAEPINDYTEIFSRFSLVGKLGHTVLSLRAEAQDLVEALGRMDLEESLKAPEGNVIWVRSVDPMNPMDAQVWRKADRPPRNVGWQDVPPVRHNEVPGLNPFNDGIGYSFFGKRIEFDRDSLKMWIYGKDDKSRVWLRPGVELNGFLPD